MWVRICLRFFFSAINFGVFFRFFFFLILSMYSSNGDENYHSNACQKYMWEAIMVVEGV